MEVTPRTQSEAWSSSQQQSECRRRRIHLVLMIRTTLLLHIGCCWKCPPVRAWSSSHPQQQQQQQQQHTIRRYCHHDWNRWCDERDWRRTTSTLLYGLEDDDSENTPDVNDQPQRSNNNKSTYNLGAGRNLPVGAAAAAATTNTSTFTTIDNALEPTVNASALGSLMGSDLSGRLKWNLPKPQRDPAKGFTANIGINNAYSMRPRRVRRMVARSQESSTLRGAIWHEEHYSKEGGDHDESAPSTGFTEALGSTANGGSSSSGDDIPFPRPAAFYPNIDLSIPPTIYDPDNGVDVVWDLMRWEAYQEAQREPLLVSFLYSSILNHDTLESSLAFLLANKLSGTMISTQINSLILEALHEDPKYYSIGRAIRADIMAVRDRDPACTCLPDVFLYFKGFHALQTYRVAHAIWKSDKRVLAHYLQSQMSQTFQIDIHPNATLGSGIMLDHGTGIVIGETASVGHNVSILHHVTLGGSGKKGVDRHPKVGNGVLLGAGASILGNVKIGEGVQVGAGGLVITDLPPHVVAVGVPVKIIGSFVDVTEQPSIKMNQMMDQSIKIDTFLSDGI